MSQELYYTPPPDEAFNDMKECCEKIWSGYDDTYGYATGKKNKLIVITNVSDNFMFMAAMFDSCNIEKLKSILMPSTLKEFMLRMP